MTAQIRSRYYHARFVLLRPFLYKAIHFPERIAGDEAEFCALAIKAACLWSIASPSPRDRKRLVPHLFTWTQAFLGILLLFKMVEEREVLRHACEQAVSRAEMDHTTALLLEWLEDVAQLDGIAEWSFHILQPLFGSQHWTG